MENIYSKIDPSSTTLAHVTSLKKYKVYFLKNPALDTHKRVSAFYKHKRISTQNWTFNKHSVYLLKKNS